jgi:hypothetical protein
MDSALQMWGYRKLQSRNYPVVGALSVHNPQQTTFNLKDSLGAEEVVSDLFLRVVGTIVKVGAAAGTATGKENPEGIIRSVTLKSSPSYGVVTKNALTARVSIAQGIFDRGFSIRTTDLTDAAGGVTAVDFSIPLRCKERQASRPIEFALPVSFFDELQVVVDCGGRDRLFTGGTPPTWDLTGLALEVWAYVDKHVAQSAYHLVEEFEQSIPVLATQKDLKVSLPSGYVYTSLMLLAERDDVVDDAIINDIGVTSGGREWIRSGFNNAGMIRRVNLESVLPSEALTGLYYLSLLADGMVSRALDATQEKAELILDVTLGSGTIRNVTMRARRIKPHYLRQTDAAVGKIAGKNTAAVKLAKR